MCVCVCVQYLGEQAIGLLALLVQVSQLVVILAEQLLRRAALHSLHLSHIVACEHACMYVCRQVSKRVCRRILMRASMYDEDQGLTKACAWESS